MDEFALIRRFFTRAPVRADLGVGDDAALFRIADGQQCAVTTDALVAGRHFFMDAAPYELGQKALAVNLSDLAAMGATPIGFTLALALPELDEVWLSEFSRGLFEMAQRYGCELMGGDTTCSATLVIGITAFGEIPVGSAIRRDGAQVGDDVWVSGTLGDAALALSALQGRADVPHDVLGQIRHRLDAPTPRVRLGLALRGVAHAMLDVSDGLASDLMHVLVAGVCSARIDLDVLPMSAVLRTQAVDAQWRLALTGGDDYELCFTAAPERRECVLTIAAQTDTPLTRIGRIVMLEENSAPAIVWASDKSPEFLHTLRQARGYNHFL